MKKFYGIVVLFLAIQLSLSYYFYEAKNKLISESAINVQNTFVNTYNTIFSTFESVPNIIYNGRINNNYIASILNNAKEVRDDEYKDLLREELYSEFKTTFKDSLKKEGFEELHFVLKDGESFLRFSNPNKFGGNVLEKKESIKFVHKNKKKIKGFESDEFFNGYRYVYPIFYKNQFVGSVSITLPIKNYLKMAEKVLVAKQRFLLKANKISNEYIKNNNIEFKNCVFDKEFIVLKESKNMFNNSYKFSDDIKNKVCKKLDSEDIFSFPIKIQKNDFLLVFYPIKDINKNLSGYIMGLKKADFIKKIKHDFYKNMIFSFASLVLILLLAYYYLQLNYAKNKLEEAVKERTKELQIALKKIKQQKETLKENFDTLQENSQKDELTQIYNRKKFNEELEKSLNIFKRYHDDATLVLFDIDFFKKINDTYGHLIGDEILKGISKLVKENIRKCDIFARWGGEEFMLILPKSSKEDAIKTVNKLRQLIINHDFGLKEKVTCSFGITSYKEGDDLDTIIKRVDELLYEAKDSGRDKIICD
jgi:diguanylate cyclase (GGDEF)-like protein